MNHANPDQVRSDTGFGIMKAVARLPHWVLGVIFIANAVTFFYSTRDLIHYI